MEALKRNDFLHGSNVEGFATSELAVDSIRFITPQSPVVSSSDRIVVAMLFIFSAFRLSRYGSVLYIGFRLFEVSWCKPCPELYLDGEILKKKLQLNSSNELSEILKL